MTEKGFRKWSGVDERSFTHHSAYRAACLSQENGLTGYAADTFSLWVSHVEIVSFDCFVDAAKKVSIAVRRL